ncbi:hypothetical protein R3P38DRAFT_3488838 [Favolaschia claudopus]|uniref:Serine/threonine-protein phosphatase 1 regulatory subunit 10 n=1 Tax=Favolaschia claudopus TaxID=2862362 RepID=A0AAW0ECI6_9AGAR
MFSWLQADSPHNVHHSPPPQDWQKQAAAQPTPGPSASSPPVPHQQPTLDLSDFTSALADLPGVSASHIPRNPSLNGLQTPSTSSSTASSTPSSQSPFYPFSSHPGFYATSNSPYYVAPWPSARPSQSPDSIPLSNYSTLNGATTTSAASGSQQQQQPAQNSQMVIDPALTTMNGSTSNGTHNPYSQQPSYSSQTSSQQQQQRAQQLSAYPFLSSFPMSYYLPQQQQQQPQGTLAPHALHAPTTNSLLNAYYAQSQPSGSKLLPQQSSAQQTQPQQQPQTQLPVPLPGPSPAERRQQLLTVIRPLLVPTQFTGAGAVATLATRISDYGAADVDIATRKEILTKIRDSAGNHYFRAWAENPIAVDITREWLKAAFTASREGGEDAEQLGETIMPLLHLIDRLPMTVESLKTSKLGKLVVRLVKEPPTPAIKDMASNVERRWRQMVSDKQPGEAMVEDPKSKKRKIAETPARSLPPSKKAAVGTAKPTAVKKELAPVASSSKTTTPAAKDAKSDSGFFSAPKPKPKLPSFKKAPPVPVKKEDGTMNIAQPSAIDPFQEALKLMKAARKGSPLTTVPASTPSPHGERGGSVTASESGAPTSTTPRLGKRKKTVTWASEDKLESIRLIERAIYGDENTDVSIGGYQYTGAHRLRDLDRSEGAALHMHLFEETVDWSEPILIEMPGDLPQQIERGSSSQEKGTQEQREQTALVALYMSPSSIPDSPAEPSVVIPEEDVDKEVTEMTTGPDVDTVFWSGPAMPVDLPQQQAETPPLASVAELVGQLANGANPNPSTAPVDAEMVINAMPPEQLQSLLAQLSQFPQAQQLQQQMQQQMNVQHHQQQQQQHQTPYGDWPQLNQFSTDYSQAAYHDDGGERNGWSAGRGGRGRGRGRGRGGGGGDDGYRHNKKRLCNFFAAGRRALNQISKTRQKTDYASRNFRCKFGDLCDFSHELPSY